MSNWGSLGRFAVAVVVFSPCGRRDGNSCLRPEARRLSSPFIAHETPARALFTNSSTPFTKPSRACGKSDSSAATVTGEGSVTTPSPGISIVGFSNQVSPAPFALGVASSFSLRSPARVEASVHPVGRSVQRSSPSCFSTKFSPTSLTPNGFFRFPKCSSPISYFIESFWESSRDWPTKPSGR